MANGNGNEQNQQQPTTQPAQQPSLFRRLLAGALIGLSATPREGDASGGFGAGFDKVTEFREKREDRQAFERQEQRLVRQEGREERRLALEETESAARMPLIDLQSDRERAQLAQAQLAIQKITREFELLPKDKQEAFLDKARALSLDLTVRGVTALAETPDFESAEEARMQLMAQRTTVDGDLRNSPFSLITLPLPFETDGNKFGVFSIINEQSSQIIGKETVIEIGGRKLTLPATTPAGQANQLRLTALISQFEADRADARARQKAALEPPSLDLKDALQQARQELAPAISAQSLLPESQREFKSQADVERRINTRAQELLSMDRQLRGIGSNNSSNLTLLVSELEGARKRGASDREIAAAVVAARQAGLIQTEEEAAFIFAKLRLDPSTIFNTGGPRAPENLPPGITPDTGAGVRLPVPGNIRVPR